MNIIIKSLLRRFVRVARPHLRVTGLLQTAGVFSRSALVWTPGGERVVVLAPHMDDETIGCGGTLALHAAKGARIAVIFLTDGRSGGAGIGALDGDARRRKQQELISIRKRESTEALKSLGVNADVHYLDICDGQLTSEVEVAASRLRILLEKLRPEIVYLPHFIEEHLDHRAVSQVLLKAAEHGPQFQCAAYEVWTPLFPNCLVDISTTMPLKRRALECYGSQLADGDYLHAVEGLNAYRSIALSNSHGSFAEAFFACPLRSFSRAYAEFTTQYSHAGAQGGGAATGAAHDRPPFDSVSPFSKVIHE